MSECKCHEIEAEIKEKFPLANWNVDAACEEWGKRKKELEDNKLKFEPYADENYACTCPTCGRIVCGWCV